MTPGLCSVSPLHSPDIRCAFAGLLLRDASCRLLFLFASCGMRGRELEAILVELAVSDADLLRASFESMVAEAAIRSNGEILFDIRTDGDPDVQRIAAIAFADADVAFVLLHADGTRHTVVSPQEDLSDFVDPLSRWFALSLHERAAAPFRSWATLLLGALRRCGCL